MSMIILILVSGNIQAQEDDTSELDPMIVTATRGEKKDIEIPASTQVFTSEDIKNMGAKTLLDVISTVPDFSISRSPSGNGLPGFRGITGYLTILVNGIPLANDGYFQLGSFATSGIERVELVKGGSAVLYGSDATTGVVNIITKKDGPSTISVGAGNNGKRQGSAFLSAKGLSLAYEHFQEQQRGLIYTSRTNYYGDDLKRDNLTLNYELNKHFNFMFLHSQRETTSSKYSASTGLSAGAPWENETVYDIGQASYKHENLKIMVYGQNREWTYTNPTGKQRGRIYGADIQDKWVFEKFSLTAGGNFDHELSKRINNDAWVKNTRNKGALFFLTETDLFASTKFLAGAREVLSNASDNVFCPQFQILQALGDSSNLYLNINRSLREPTLSQRYGYSATQEPNGDLESEIGWTYEMGWKTLFTRFDSLKLALFHMDIDNRIYSGKTSEGKTIYLNANKFRNTGVELAFRHDTATGLIGGAGLYYGKPEQKTVSSDDWEDTEFRFGMQLNLGYRFSKGMVNLMVHHASDRVDDTDPLWDVSLNAAYDITDKDSIRLNVNNLLDRDDAINAGGSSILEERGFLLTYEHTF